MPHFTGEAWRRDVWFDWICTLNGFTWDRERWKAGGEFRDVPRSFPQWPRVVCTIALRDCGADVLS